MTESRIRVALSEVEAVLDLNRQVLARLAELEAEDPSFGLPVRSRLTEAARALVQGSWSMRQARRHLSEADGIENPRSA